MDSYSENQGKELNASGKRELTDKMIEKLLSVYESSVKNHRFQFSKAIEIQVFEGLKVCKNLNLYPTSNV